LQEKLHRVTAEGLNCSNRVILAPGDSVSLSYAFRRVYILTAVISEMFAEHCLEMAMSFKLRKTGFREVLT
jgi:hypothetical protein